MLGGSYVDDEREGMHTTTGRHGVEGVTIGKRRRTQSASSQSIEANSSVYDTPGEMLDCIEVSPSGAVQAVAANDLRVPAGLGDTELGSPPKRKRGRPRKNPLPPVPNLSMEAQASRVEVMVPGTSLVKEEIVDDGGVQDSVLQIPERGDQALQSDLSRAEAATTLVTDSAELVMTEAVTADEGTAQPDITASLQGILDRLKSTRPGDVDLRGVDDLCFQIRFHAQVAAQQQGV